MKIEALLREMVSRNASDLHIKVGTPPAIRVDGTLLTLNEERIQSGVMDDFMSDIMNRSQIASFEKDKEIDFAIGARNLGRFRINVFRQRGSVAMAIRHIAGTIPTYETLNLPNVVLDMSLRKRGMVLVTGTTGSGKSTTLASMIDHINEHVSDHIITIEDPIEFLHRDKKSIVSQRELGNDTFSFANALRSAMRQDPDVILVGEIRDELTMTIALTAAKTGHMVFSTIHTTNATETLTRILSMYPPHQHEEIRLLLSEVLVGVISQRLLVRKDGSGRVPACEVMVNTGTVKDYIRDPENITLIESAIAEGRNQYNSQTFDQSIFALYQDDLISYEVAYQSATNPDDFDLKIRGIEGTSDRSWMT